MILVRSVREFFEMRLKVFCRSKRRFRFRGQYQVFTAFPLTPALSLREREASRLRTGLLPKPSVGRTASTSPTAAPMFSLSQRERAGVRGKESSVTVCVSRI